MTRTTILHGRPDRYQEVDRQDTPEAAEARVSLKLAAEGYNASRYGADAGGRLTAAALFVLRGRAIYYYGRLNRIDLRSRLPGDLRELHVHPLIDQTFATLQVAAMTYSNTRNGVDAHREFTGAAIAELCAAAVAYVDALLQVATDHEGPGDAHRRSRRRSRTSSSSALPTIDSDDVPIEDDPGDGA